MVRNKRNKRQPVAQVQQLERLMQMLTTSVAPKPPVKRRRRARNRKAAVSEEGTITLRRHELVKTLTTDDKGALSGSVALVPKSFSFLKGIAASFEHSRWHKLQVYYKPAVAVTTGGLIAIGMDWDNSSSNATTRETISAFTPSMHFPAWKDTSTMPMVLPPRKLQTRMWYPHNSASADAVDKGPGTLRIAGEINGVAAKTNVGELWIAYEVQMQGTNPN